MKILLTGVSGLIGSAFAEAALRRGHKVIGLYHSREKLLMPPGETRKLDLTDPDAITRIVLDEFPDAIVNAAAMSVPADVDSNPELGEKLNVELPTLLAKLANHLSSRFIHLSTDMVFDGKTGSYRSTDTPAPVNKYGEQKLEAEKQILRAAAPFSVVLRITVVTGNSPSGQRSVHERLFEMWAKGEKPTLYTDEIRQPCSADNVAEAMVECVERNDLSGIFHWAGKDRLSRYEMGKKIIEHFNLPQDLIQPISLKDNGVGQSRPANLTLDLHPLEGKLKTQPMSFDEQLELMSVPIHCRKWYNSL